MQHLIQTTWSAFQTRNLVNNKEVLHEERDVFNETLTENVRENLGTAESALYLKCRATINCGLEMARAREISAGLEHFRKVEVILCSSSVSYPCKLLIGTFYSAGLAYLRLKEFRPDEADALSLQTLAIDNYLIQEHGYHILEMHRVQQLVNLVRIQISIGQRSEAFRLLFALIRCFEDWPAVPVPQLLNALDLYKEKYAGVPVFPSAIGSDRSFLKIEKVYTTPVTRFKYQPGENNLLHLDGRYLLDFSALSSEWIKRTLDQIIVEFIRFTKGLHPNEVIAILNTNNINILDDLKGLENYKSAYLFLAIKLHAINEDQKIFLTLLKSFCEMNPSAPIWEAIASDFYGFCITSGIVTQDIKEKVRVMASTELSKVII